MDITDHPSGVELDIVVVNHGSLTAYDVVVVVDLVYPGNSSHFYSARTDGALGEPVGSASLENNGYRLRWSIPELGGLQRQVLELNGDAFARIRTSGSDPTFDRDAYTHEFFGEVTTSSFDRNLENNTFQVWTAPYSNDPAHTRAVGNYTVLVTVDDPSPSPGGTVNFTITATKDLVFHNFPLSTNDGALPIDLQVDIELTDGLSVSGSPSYRCANLDTCIVPGQVSYSNGVFNVGTLKYQEAALNSVTLPVLVSSSAVVNEQCVTATLTGNPPPGVGLYGDYIADNVAKVCLGDQPVEPFVTGEVEIFTVYDCFARQTYPCDGTDGVRVRAVNKNTDPGTVVAPGRTIVQVQDCAVARTYDDYIRNSTQQSVTDPNTVSWQTATDAHDNFTGVRKGLKIFFSRVPFNGQLDNWIKVAGEHVKAEGLDGGNPPGVMHIRTSTGSAITRMNSGNNWTVTYGGTASKTDTLGPGRWFAEFSKLGTYVVEYTTIGDRDNTNGDCDSEYLPTGVTAAYCDTEIYTFHVGPMADLAVEDGGTSSHVANDQHALAIVAVNNGPNPSPGATVTGLPTGATVLHVSQGTYDSTDGEWNIGELKLRGYYRSAGEPEPTLVLSASAGDTADVSIASTENYEVCVGGKDNPGNLAHTTQSACEAVTNASWNSTPVYDYNSGNNTATITAQLGTGGGGEGSPTLRGADDPGASITVTWDAVETVNSVPVSHYEVQRETNPWVTVADDVEGTQYVDTDVNPGDTYPVPGAGGQRGGRGRPLVAAHGGLGGRGGDHDRNGDSVPGPSCNRTRRTRRFTGISPFPGRRR